VFRPVISFDAKGRSFITKVCSGKVSDILNSLHIFYTGKVAGGSPFLVSILLNVGVSATLPGK
jgi:hypothetical protein